MGRRLRLTASLPCHVWFVDEWTGVTARPPQIGLLLEWQHRDDGWWGLVAHAHAGGLLTTWRRASELKPYAASAQDEARP